MGFVDEGHKRVGCLLHPSLHQGVDLRTNSFYGVELCDTHFCPSFTYLTEEEQKAVILSLDDWYLYGLVITDIDLVKQFFAHVQNRMGDKVRVERLDDQKVQKVLREFFALKECWKFLSPEPRLGKYHFTHSEYSIARIEYGKRWGMYPSRFDKIFISLSSAFRTENEIKEAESIIEEMIVKFIEVY